MPTHNAKPRPSEKELERMYHGEGLTQKAIAEKVGVTPTTIKRWMRDAHIQRRQTLDEKRAERRKQRGNGNSKPRPSDEELRRLHDKEGFTQKEIAAQLGVVYGTVKNWLDDAGIQTRVNRWDIQNAAPASETERRKPKAAELRHMYHEEQLTQRQIAKRVGYSYSMVKRWFNDYGIPRRASGWGERQRTQRLDDKAKPAAFALPSLPSDEMEPDLAPFPTPGKRGTRKAVRPWQRLTSVERGIVAKSVDDFLIWVGKKREEEEYA